MRTPARSPDRLGHRVTGRPTRSILRAYQALSERRADSVAVALENEGVGKERIATKGYGKRYPVAPNRNSDGTDNPSGRTKNRRVEVIIEN